VRYEVLLVKRHRAQRILVSPRPREGAAAAAPPEASP
jgi:hypothetical protein